MAPIRRSTHKELAFRPPRHPWLIISMFGSARGRTFGSLPPAGHMWTERQTDGRYHRELSHQDSRMDGKINNHVGVQPDLSPYYDPNNAAIFRHILCVLVNPGILGRLILTNEVKSPLALYCISYDRPMYICVYGCSIDGNNYVSTSIYKNISRLCAASTWHDTFPTSTCHNIM